MLTIVRKSENINIKFDLLFFFFANNSSILALILVFYFNDMSKTKSYVLMF